MNGAFQTGGKQSKEVWFFEKFGHGNGAGGQATGSFKGLKAFICSVDISFTASLLGAPRPQCCVHEIK